jgi:NADPH2:quinone reductase
MIKATREMGRLSQLGYVVTDIERAIDGWAADGVGPWYLLPHVDTTQFVYRGEASTIDMSIGIAYAGGMQLELIEQHCHSDSLYREFLGRHGEGLQHLGHFPEDFDATEAALTAAGWGIGQRGHLGTGRFIYFDNQHHPGTTMEISEWTESRRNFFAKIEAECLAWDGNGDPRRSR